MKTAIQTALAVVTSLILAWAGLEARNFCASWSEASAEADAAYSNVPESELLATAIYDIEVENAQPLSDFGMAIDFQLPSVHQEGLVRLSDYRGKKPVALIFGSYSCPFFRAGIADLRRVYEAHYAQVQFFLVYTREAHRSLDGRNSWQLPDIQLTEPGSIAQRKERCREVQRRMKLAMPALVDSLDNKVCASYKAEPVCLCLIDKGGKLVYRSPGSLPLGFKPREFGRAIEALVATET